jgi:hypothetical protein
MQNAIANAVSGGVNPGIEVIVKELNVIVKLQKDIRGEARIDVSRRK